MKQGQSTKAWAVKSKAVGRDEWVMVAGPFFDRRKAVEIAFRWSKNKTVNCDVRVVVGRMTLTKDWSFD